MTRRVGKCFQVLIQAPQFALDPLLYVDIRGGADPFKDAPPIISYRDAAYEKPPVTPIGAPQASFHLEALSRTETMLPAGRQLMAFFGVDCQQMAIADC